MARLRILVASAGFLLLVAGAGAQPMIQRGVSGLSVHISPDFEGAIGDMIFAEAGYGWFLRDGLAVRGTLSYAILEDIAGEDSDYRTSEIGVAAEYHIDLGGKLIPYLGAGLGWRRSHFGKLAESGLGWISSDNLRNQMWLKWAQDPATQPAWRIDRYPGLLRGDVNEEGVA